MMGSVKFADSSQSYIPLLSSPLFSSHVRNYRTAPHPISVIQVMIFDFLFTATSILSTLTSQLDAITAEERHRAHGNRHMECMFPGVRVLHIQVQLAA
jgi:hypothetical protein